MNPLLVASFIGAFAVDVVSPVLVALFIWRRWRPRGRVWFYGAGVFLVFQVLTRIPALLFIQSQKAVQDALKESLALYVLFVLAISLSAGLFEEGGRWLGYRYLVRERTWPTALLYGAGHGGLESIGIGLLVGASLVGYMTLMGMPAEVMRALPPERLEQIQAGQAAFTGLQGWEPLLGGWERLAAQAIQMALSLLVLQAFVRSARWWWYALAAHTGVDFSSVLLVRYATETWGQTTGMLIGEGLVTLYGLLAVWIVVRLCRGDQQGVRSDFGDDK